MNYISFSFLILFLFVFSCRLTIGRTKNETKYLLVLLFSSLVYYAWHIPAYICIIFLSTIIDYLTGIYLGKDNKSAEKRRIALAISLACNLGLLCFFKYSNFFLSQLTVALSTYGLNVQIPHLHIILPMGISFYTFQSMSYSIDIYRKKLEPVSSFWKFLLFVSFFPQLTAGPIVRAKDFLYQINRKRRVNLQVLSEGFYLIIRGIFLKMVIADNCGYIVDQYWGVLVHPEEIGSFAALYIVILFSCQIFSDFAGYSSIARGLAYILGFRLPINFNSPYIAKTFSEFWRRWHITLSEWLRDYLYIPLGGNRKKGLRVYINLFIVMFLGGLWHGASLTFIVWGVIHAYGLIVERCLFKVIPSNKSIVMPAKIFWYLVVQLTVLIAWIFFRSDSTEIAFNIIRNIFRFQNVGQMAVPCHYALLILPIMFMHGITLMTEYGYIKKPDKIVKSVAAAFMLVAAITLFGNNNAFIYFQF